MMNTYDVKEDGFLLNKQNTLVYVNKYKHLLYPEFSIIHNKLISYFKVEVYCTPSDCIIL